MGNEKTFLQHDDKSTPHIYQFAFKVSENVSWLMVQSIRIRRSVFSCFISIPRHRVPVLSGYCCMCIH